MPKIIEERVLKLDDIVEDEDKLMMRVKLDHDTVIEYAAAMRAGSVFAPVDCMQVGDEILLTDGFHRIASNRRNGEQQIRALVAQGTMDDAILAAVRSGAHGRLKRSNADKRKSVLALLAMPLCQDWSDRKIAAEAGVDHEFVRKLRRTTENQESTGDGRQLDDAKQAQGPAKPEKRLGRDNRRRSTKRTRRPRVQPPQLTPLKSYTPALDPTLASQPDPEFPGQTYGDTHTRRYGFVNVIPVELRDLQNKQMAVRDFGSAVGEFGKAAKAFLKVKSFAPDEFLQVLTTLPNGGQKYHARVLEHIDDLMIALHTLEPFAALKPKDKANGS